MNMIIKLHKFGEMLISRPAGRDAYLSAKAYLLPKKPGHIIFNFEKVKVLTPSWIDEFVTLMRQDFPEVKIEFSHSNNPTVFSSLKLISASSPPAL